MPSTFVRLINERRLLNTMRIGGPMSRADLERSLRLTTPTVHRIVERLVRGGWIHEVGRADPNMGRPPILIELNAQGHAAVGVELGRKIIRMVHVNLIGEHQTYFERPMQSIQTERDLIQAIQSFIEMAQLSREHLLGIGLTAPNVEAVNGRSLITVDTFPLFDRVSVEALSSELSVPIYAANDAKAAALGEAWFGEGRKASRVAFVVDDVGIGAGICDQQNTFENHADDFTHMIVDLHGELCTCGSFGCVETGASERAILHAVRKRRLMRDDESVEDVIARAKAGLSPDAEVISRALDYLCAGISNLMKVVNPNLVVIGGNAILSDPFMVHETQRRMEGFQGNHRSIPVVPSGYGVWAVATGAATLVLRQVYDHTQVVDSLT